MVRISSIKGRAYTQKSILHENSMSVFFFRKKYISLAKVYQETNFLFMLNLYIQHFA